MRTLLILAFSMVLFGSKNSFAQCVNTPNPTYGVYEMCFARYCPCSGGADEYFISYGRRYCEAFLGSANFSPDSQIWRDKALNCLQEKIVPKLDISGSSTCSCSTMKTFAFRTHVDCYTQTGASICDLGIGDVTAIGWIIDASDLLTIDSLHQSTAVADICKTTAPDDGRRTLWRGFSAALSIF